MLLGTTALAEIQISGIVDEFNIYAGMFDVPDLDAAKADIWESGGLCYAGFLEVETGVSVFFALNGDSHLQSMCCRCSDENNIADFLAYCCSTVLYCYGHDNVIEMFGRILFDYMMLRNDGKPLGYFNASGAFFILEFEDGMYKFSAKVANTR
jgi:hypothetical protein